MTLATPWDWTWEDAQAENERSQMSRLADQSDAALASPGLPRLLSADEALGTYDPSKWDRLAARTAPAPLTRGQRGMRTAANAIRGAAHGLAVGTGLPAWRRAAASIDADMETQGRVEAIQAKSRLEDLARIAKQREAEERRRADYTEHPMAEYEGQRMPADMAMRLASQAATRTVQGQQSARLATMGRIRAEDTVADNARADSELQRREEALRSQRDAATAAEAGRGARHRASLDETMRHNVAMETRVPGGGPKAPAPISDAQLAALMAKARAAIVAERSGTFFKQDNPGVPQIPTEAEVMARVQQDLASIQQIRATMAGDDEPDPFGDVSTDLFEEDEGSFVDPMVDDEYDFNLGD